MKKVLTREEILNSDDIKLVEIDVPEWGGKVFVRSLTGKERDHHEQEIFKESRKNKDGSVNVRASFVALGVVDEKGKRIFTKEDITALGEKSAAPLDRIADKIRELSGMMPSAEDIKKAEENLNKGQSEDSTSV